MVKETNSTCVSPSSELNGMSDSPIHTHTHNIPISIRYENGMLLNEIDPNNAAHPDPIRVRVRVSVRVRVR